MKTASKIVRLLPLLVPYTLLVLGGFVFALLQSLGVATPVESGEPVFASFIKAFSTPWFFRSFGYSVYIGFVSALISVTLGVWLAYFLWQLPLKRQKIVVVTRVPLILPHIAVGFLVLLFFSQSGFLASLAYHLGMVDSPAAFPSLVYNPGGWGIILAYVYKEVPFVVLMVFAVLIRFNRDIISAASMLGAGKTAVFFRIMVPYLYPVIGTTFLILFLFSFGAFDIPYLIGTSNPEMLTIHVYNTYFKRDLALRPYAMAMLILMLLFSLSIIWIYAKLIRKIDIRYRSV
jgi:putative spermidine/putrescine transport system permease protein